MSDIILNGVSITELKKQKALIQKDASAFIARGINDATALLESILNAVDDEDSELDRESIEAAAAQAVEILENVDVVAGVSDVSYYLPFYAEYSDDRPYSGRLEDSDRLEEILDGEYLWRDAGPLGRLYGVLGGMESNSKLWNTSYC